MRKIFAAAKGEREKQGERLACDKGCVLDHEWNLYREAHFRALLALERKRSERSGKPFLLMCLHIDKNLLQTGIGGFRQKLTDALFSATREIDMKGWSEYGAVIGIIFPEIHPGNGETLRRKLQGYLTNALGEGVADSIRIVCRPFPEKNKQEDTFLEDDCCFYPDTGKCHTLVKRGIDIGVSVAALVILLPLLLAIALLVKLTSGGPVLFSQERVGHRGRRFTFFKFRTMYANSDPSLHREYVRQFIRSQASYSDGGNERDGEKVYKIKNDPRVTPLGRILRKTSLDELPQFMNVLKGEMSLVGPRPPIPYELENYDIWHKRRVLEVKPGITGLWQVAGRSRTTFDEMVRLDLAYIQKYSLWLDLKILLLTPLAVVTGRGSY